MKSTVEGDLEKLMKRHRGHFVIFMNEDGYDFKVKEKVPAAEIIGVAEVFTQTLKNDFIRMMNQKTSEKDMNYIG